MTALHGTTMAAVTSQTRRSRHVRAHRCVFLEASRHRLVPGTKTPYFSTGPNTKRYVILPPEE
eukprot:1846366-Rhodomonas_salina.1